MQVVVLGEKIPINMFWIEVNKDKDAFIFHKRKNRLGKLEEQAFIIQDHKFKKIDIFWAKEDKTDEEIKKIIIDLIKNSEKPPRWSDLMNYFKNNYNADCRIHYPKNKVANVIRSGEGRYWRIVKIKKNNQTLYFPIEENTQAKIEVEIVEYKNPADKSDKSDNSNLRAFSKLYSCGQVRNQKICI